MAVFPGSLGEILVWGSVEVSVGGFHFPGTRFLPQPAIFVFVSFQLMFLLSGLCQH